MPPSVTVTAATPDADSDDPPFKLSRQVGKDQAVIMPTYSPEAGGSDILRYIELRQVSGPVGDPDIGKIRDHLGVVCGRGNRCGMIGSRPLASTDYIERPVWIEDEELPSEGDYTFEALARSDAGVN